MLVLDLIYNLAILISLSIFSGIIDTRFDKNTLPGKILQGFLFGFIAVVGMLYSFKLSEGIIFDGRSIVISLCTLFFGPLAGAISGLIAGGYRIYLSGAGTIAGIFTIVESYLIGLFFYFYTRKKELIPSTITLFSLGIVVHIVMLVVMFALPAKGSEEFFKIVAPTVIIFYPIITLIIGKTLSDQWKHKETLKLLKDSEIRYQTFFNTDKDLIFLKDLQFRYRLFNKAVLELYNITAENLIGKTDFEVMEEQYARMCNISDKATIETNSLVVVDEFYGDKVFEVKKFPVVLSKNEKYVGGIIIDITEKVQMFKLIQAEKRRYEETLEAVNDGIYELKLPEGQITASANFYKLLGYKESNHISLEDFLNVVYQDDRQLLQNEVESSARTGKFFYCDIRLERKDGEFIWVSVKGVPMESNPLNQKVRIVGTVSDITERKGFEQQLQEKINQLERFNKFLVDREIRVVELKREINSLLQQLGQLPRYNVEPKNNEK
ncbi:MAG: LytS/YhcK type 5TM receptor domain-containing protein [Ignavibacteria bacterium]